MCHGVKFPCRCGIIIFARDLQRGKFPVGALGCLSNNGDEITLGESRTT